MPLAEFTMLNAFEALITWIPFLFASGFLFNANFIVFHVIWYARWSGSGIGTNIQNRPYPGASWFFTQLFRNSPWLVILFIVLLALPFEFVIFV